MKQILIVFLVFCFSINCFSQTKISGRLSTVRDQPISGASILITELNSDDILNYDISNSKGFFSISITSKKEKLHLNIRSMGFKTIIQIIDNKNQNLNLILEEEITELKEVVLKSNPITKRSDTINYSVNAFTKQEDRTIADVLKNMPGIEVLSDGKILYQGKPINKYYIEGLDLLGGKYNLANSNLPHKEVTRVQVLENHQPVKILDSLVYSDQAAINIKLKNSYTFTGQAELGSGFPSLLWDVNITPMLFSKKRQMLSSYQSNNIGDNVASQLKTLTIEDLLEQFERNDEKQDWLTIQQIEVPNFSEKRWLDNNIHVVSINYLQKLKKDYELRLNVAYLNDYQQQKGFTNTQFFTAVDTIALFENKYNQLYLNTLETDLTLQKNTDNKFFKNSFTVHGFLDGQRGVIQLNDENIHQNLRNHYFKLSNDLKALFPFGKQIVTLKSYVGLNKTPQSLTVNPGQFNNLLNDGNQYEEVAQNIELNTFYTNNSLGFTKGWKAFSFSPKIGFQSEIQQLRSDILISNTDQIPEFKNNLNWKRSKPYAYLHTQYKSSNWRIELKTPVNFHNYQLKDQPLQKSQNLNRITFEPKFSITYDLTSFWRLGTSTQISNQFGTISQIYYNYILQNYRSIQRINAPLSEIQNLGYSLSIGYRNPIKSIFFSVIYNYTKTDNNLLYSNEILNNGAIELQAIEKNNERLSHNFMMKTSKYFSEFNTNLTFNVNYSLQDFQQVLNSEITDIVNQYWRLNGKIDTDITDWMNTELESIFQFSNNQIQNQENQTVTQQFHKINVNIYPRENHYIGLKTEYVKNNIFSENVENFFADLTYRYTWKKRNIDLELQFNNIFDTQTFRTINISNFSYIESNFRLRPRQVLFNVRLSL